MDRLDRGTEILQLLSSLERADGTVPGFWTALSEISRVLNGGIDFNSRRWVRRLLPSICIAMSSHPPLALVTGASSGLGVEFAHLLAGRGYDLVLTARRHDRLEALAGELRRLGTWVKIVPLDLAQAEGPSRLAAEVDLLGRHLDLLVNNAGFGCYGPFVDQSDGDFEGMIQLNLMSLTKLTRHYADRMKQRRSGSILQVASYAGLQPIPRYAVYSATKAYVIALTQAIRYELRKHGVRIAVLCPGFMATEFHDAAHHRRTKAMRWLTVDARYVAKKGLDGLAGNKLLISPGIWYRTNNWALRLLPRTAAAAIAAGIVKSSKEAA